MSNEFMVKLAAADKALKGRVTTDPKCRKCHGRGYQLWYRAPKAEAGILPCKCMKVKVTEVKDEENTTS